MSESESAISHLSMEDRLAITRGVMNLFDNWGLRAEESMALLNMEGKPRHFVQYRHDKPLPDDPQLMKRVEYLIKIDAALRTTYPTNPAMGKRWLRQASKKLQKRTPLSLMIGEGEKGLVNVLCQLDCSYAWDLSGSKAN
jgi:hypothetical protein